jgi:LemA protein
LTWLTSDCQGGNITAIVYTGERAVTGLIAYVVVLALLGIAVVWAVGVYNGLIRLRNLVQESWRQIDVELTRRHDLIPDLVETVRGYACQERATLDAVLAARGPAASPAASVAGQAAAERTLSAALGRLFAVAETYPALTANQNYLALQSELTDAEDRVAAGRRFYNANVRELNTRVESLPASLFAKAFAVRRAEYFEVRDLSAGLAPMVAPDRGMTPKT